MKRSSCENGKGNYGINSFNFLAFVLLTYNVVANVNNNLNNNNNNKNDQNINAISQNSNNVATNTNVGNQIGVTVLPIPGKRAIDSLRQNVVKLKKCKVDIIDNAAALLFNHLMQLKKSLDNSEYCRSYKICNSIKQITEELNFEDAISMGLQKQNEIPFLKIVKCETLFPECAF